MFYCTNRAWLVFLTKNRKHKRFKKTSPLATLYSPLTTHQMTTTETPGRTILIDQQPHLFFSGYAYLGMSGLPAFRELVKEGLDRYGLSFPSSRISNTRLALFETFEQLLSGITGMEDTVCFASGFVAGTLASMPWHNSSTAAPGTHPAIYKGKAVSGSFAAWADSVTQSINNGATTTLLSDAVNIFTPTLHDFSFLNNCQNAVTCVIDDSHSIGFTGVNGGGVATRIPKGKHRLVVPYSLSKGFNLIGGAISCDAATAQQLRSKPEYTAATSLSPAYVHAFVEGQSLYAQQRNRLQQNIQLLQQLLSNVPGISHHPELPIVTLPASIDEQALQRQNIVISSFAYPDPRGKKMQRIVVNALHTAEDITYLAGVVKTMLEQ